MHWPHYQNSNEHKILEISTSYRTEGKFLEPNIWVSHKLRILMDKITYKAITLSQISDLNFLQLGLF